MKKKKKMTTTATKTERRRARARHRQRARHPLRDQRGQALVSYTIITAVILGGLTTMSLVILPRLLDALNSYTRSLYFCINLPFP